MHVSARQIDRQTNIQMTMTVPDNMGATLGSTPGSSKLKHVTTGDMK